MPFKRRATESARRSLAQAEPTGAGASFTAGGGNNFGARGIGSGNEVGLEGSGGTTGAGVRARAGTASTDTAPTIAILSVDGA